MLDQLAKLGLSGIAQAFAELEASGEGATLTHADWLGLLVDREVTHRRDKRLAARLRYARLRYVGSAAVGQGLETVMAQIAADTLGIPLDRVRVFHGSTSYLEEGYGAFHSR